MAAGAVVQPGVVVPAGELWAGNPARKLRAVKPNETEYFSTVRLCHVSRLAWLALLHGLCLPP